MKHGDFVWYELLTTNTEGATAFYKRVIGWDAADSELPGMAYTILTAGADRIGGLMALPDEARAEGAPPGWMGYIAVDDVDAYAKTAKEAGGSIRRVPDDIPGVGRFAVVADPHGAVFTLFQGTGEAPPPAAPDAPGHIGWHELYAGDREEAFKFYATLFGWTKSDAIDMGAMGTYQMFATGSGRAVGGMVTKMAHQPRPYWLYYVNVEAIDAAAARATEGGGQLVHGPSEVPGGLWIVQMTDPQGAMFAMVAPKR